MFHGNLFDGDLSQVSDKLSQVVWSERSSDSLSIGKSIKNFDG